MPATSISDTETHLLHPVTVARGQQICNRPIQTHPTPSKQRDDIGRQGQQDLDGDAFFQPIATSPKSHFFKPIAISMADRPRAEPITRKPICLFVRPAKIRWPDTHRPIR
ncbi:hypothetical protein ACLOJK_027202 [Asimina triloba]